MSLPPDPAAPPTLIFNRRLHARRLARAAPRLAAHAFLLRPVLEDLIERLTSVNRRFERALDLGARGPDLGEALLRSGRVERVVRASLAPALAGSHGVVGDEEAPPFGPGSFDLVISALSLHWVNDLPGALIQIRRMLAPDGLFLGALFGGRTLRELRQALLEAELETREGAAPRISPFIDVLDGARLLQRAGFAMPVADADVRAVRYGEPMRLLADLRGMGECAAFASPSPPLTRRALLRAMELYRERHADADGRSRASFEIITLSGWAPGPGQPEPRRPGSAQVRLAEALGVTERSAGEAAPRSAQSGPKD